MDPPKGINPDTADLERSAITDVTLVKIRVIYAGCPDNARIQHTQVNLAGGAGKRGIPITILFIR